MGKMKGIKTMKLVDLNLLPGNSKKHPERQIKVLVQSLRKHGQTRPLIVNRKETRGVRNVILAGNGTFEAMGRLGWEDCGVIVYSLNESDAIALAETDNKSGELGEVDEVNLRANLKLIAGSDMDLAEIGFMEDEVNKMLMDSEENYLGNDPEIKFSKEFMESHNYVILYFDNELDWNTAIDKLGLGKVHANDSKPGTGYERKGLSQAINGSEVLGKL